MKQLKRTYALPESTVSRFEQAVGPGRRSGTIAELIDEYLEERQREALRRDLDEGCKAMWDEYLQVEREFRSADEELHRAVEY